MPINPPFISEIGLQMVIGTYTAVGEPDDRYRRAYHDLLPPGPALPTDEGTDLDDTCRGLGRELVRTEAEVWLLWLEMNPLTSAFLIERWEELCGLPAECGDASPILDERRAQVVAAIFAASVGSIESFEFLAETMGYTVTIVEGWTLAARCGQARCGDARSSGRHVLFQWTVSTTSGENDTQLQCIFEKFKPKHTTIYWDITP